MHKCPSFRWVEINLKSSIFSYIQTRFIVKSTYKIAKIIAFAVLKLSLLNSNRCIKINDRMSWMCMCNLNSILLEYFRRFSCWIKIVFIETNFTKFYHFTWLSRCKTGRLYATEVFNCYITYDTAMPCKYLYIVCHSFRATFRHSELNCNVCCSVLFVT